MGVRMPTIFQQQPDPELTAKPEHPSVSMPTRMGVFAAYALHPGGVRFETQEDKEEVILFLRQHIVLLLPTVVVGLLMALAPTIVFPLLMRIVRSPIEIPWGYITVGTVFWYVLTFGIVLSRFIHWFFNIFIVTDHRIIDIDFINLLYKEFSETKLSRIQDISYNTKGIFATMWNYGDVMIQTAGEQSNFEFESVPRPAAVVDVVSDLIATIKEEG